MMNADNTDSLYEMRRNHEGQPLPPTPPPGPKQESPPGPPPGYQTETPRSAQPNPQPGMKANEDVEKLAKTLEEKSAKYETLKQATEILAQRGSVSPEMLEKLKQAAEQYLHENVEQEMKSHLRGKEAEPQPKAGPQSQAGAQTGHTADSASQTGTGTFNASQSAQSKTSWSKSPPWSDKKLYRVEYDKWLAGVCGGLGEYFQIDSAIIRVIFVIGCIPPLTLFGIVIYAVLAIMLPLKYSPEGAESKQ